MSLISISDRIGFTKPPHGSAVFFITPMAVRKADEITVTTTVANSTTQTILGTLDIPAMSFVSQGGAAGVVTGTIRNHVSAGATIVLRATLTIGGSTTTIMESSAIALSTSVNSRHWQLGVAVIGTTQSTALRTWGEAFITNPTTRSLAPVASNLASQRTMTVANTTTAATLKITAALSAASTGLTASLVAGWLETVS